MNSSSSSNLGSSGFQNPQAANSNFWFTSRPLDPSNSSFSTSSGLTKPRLWKMRKHVASHNPRSKPDPEIRPFDHGLLPSRPISSYPPRLSDSVGLGDFNASRAGKEAFAFGAHTTSNASSNLNFQGETSSGNMNRNTISFDMDFVGKESLFRSEGASRNSFVFGSDGKNSSSLESSASMLPNEIINLKIDGSWNRESSSNTQNVNTLANEKNGAHYRFGSGENASGSFKTNVTAELENELKKMNIRYPLGRVESNDTAEGHKRFSFENSTKVVEPLYGTFEATLQERIKNLNIKESLNSQCDMEKAVLQERINNLNIKESLNSQCDKEKASTTFNGVPTRTQMGETPMKNDKEWASASVPFGFSFQTGMRERASNCDRIPLYPQNNDSKLTSNEKNVQFDFTSKWSGLGTPHVEFKTPEPRGNLFSGLNRKHETKGELGRGSRSRKKKGKLSRPSVQLRPGQDFIVDEKISPENDEPLESYSPMDVSPYRETVVDEHQSRETSVTSEDAVHVDVNFASSEFQPTYHLNAEIGDDFIATCNEPLAELKGEGSSNCCVRDPCVEFPSEEFVSGAETESFKSAAEQLDYSNDTASSSDMSVTAVDTGEVSSTRLDRQNSDERMQFRFASTPEDSERSNFTFSASCSAQYHSAASTRQRKKKDRLKVTNDALSSTSNAKGSYASPSVQFFPFSGASSLLSPRQGQTGDTSTNIRKTGDPCEPVKEEIRQQTNNVAASIAAQEACEKWRMRGNQSYANGDLPKAEDYYSQGVNCISQNETSRSCLRALMLCYSNRAATRMSLGRMREALEDCKIAAALDSKFLRVQVRAASCYLSLGEVESALLHFIKCLQSEGEVCVDRKLLLEASEGIENAQKVSQCMKQSAKLLQLKTSTDAERALEVIAEGLRISSFSDKLLQMKADALFMLQRYEEVIQLCEKTLTSSQIGTSIHSIEMHPENMDGSDQQGSSIWFLHFSLIIKSYFFLGRLEEALELLNRQEFSVFIRERIKNHTLESVIPLVGTVRELVRHKSAGNEAFKSGKHAEAIEHYTAAISCSVESHPFLAICFGNRAASYRAMGHVVDAIADYSLAIALDGHYMKAISRRASLYEVIRDYDQAVLDLRRILSLLIEQVEDKARPGTERQSFIDEVRQTHHKISVMEEEGRKEIPLNIYAILGVEPSATASEIKKAYKRAALKHHPDKVGQFLARIENGDNGLWKEIADEVHKDADRLFKMIGEAYAILSDPSKRSRYDLEEETRNSRNRGGASNMTRTYGDAQNYPFERSSSRRHWQDAWTSYRNSQRRG